MTETELQTLDPVDIRKAEWNNATKAEDEKPSLLTGQWTEQELAELKREVDAMKHAGKVDWELVGLRLNRSGLNCCDEYVKLIEPAWTAQEDKMLGEFWEANYTNYSTIIEFPQVGQHSLHGTQLRLAQLTKDGKFKPIYCVGEEKNPKARKLQWRTAELRKAVEQMQKSGKLDWEQIREQFNEPELEKTRQNLEDQVAKQPKQENAKTNDANQAWSEESKA